MKIRLLQMVSAFLFAGALAAVTTLNAAELTSGRPPKPGQYNPADTTLDVFEGMKSGQLEVKMVHKDVAQGKLFITNKTDKPVNVKLPDTFVGVHVLPQGIGGAGMMQGVGSGGAQMSGGGGGGGMGGAGGAGGGGGGNFFNVAAEKVGEYPFVSVCMEHGKPDPRAAMTYQLRPADASVMKPETREAIKLLTTGKITQRVAQVLAWHHQCNMSLEELAAKQIKPAVGLPYPYFDPQEIQAAVQVKAHIAKQLEEQAKQPALPNL